MMKSWAFSVQRGAFAVAISCLVAVTAGCPSGPVGPTGPTIGLSPTSLTFSGMEIGADPQDQTIQLSNTGTGTLEWSVSVNADWLSVTPTDGSTTAEAVNLTVSVDTIGLTAAGSPYTAQMTVDAAGATNTPRTVNVTLTLTAVTCESLSRAVTVDTTLSAPCYNVESSISVSEGATLTIDPGVTLRFHQGKEMTIGESGKLSAVGTTAEPIVFTGQEPIRGYWGGLLFYQSNSTINQLNHVIIEYGGGYHDGNLELYGSSSSPARVGIMNCTLRESETYGFYFNNYAIAEGFSGNTVTGNTLGAGDVAPDVAGYLDDTSTYTGNDTDVVRIRGGTFYGDQTWAGIDADYLFTGSVGVSAALTIAPGARLVFQTGEEMTVNSSGQLSAVGTADQPIVFTGEEQTPGFWGGLLFYQSNSTENQLDHVTIEYGGGYHDGNLELYGSSSSPVQLEATNCTFQQSATWGVYMNNYVNVNADFDTANTFSGNTLGDIYTP